jgi:hypothetical protein
LKKPGIYSAADQFSKSALNKQEIRASFIGLARILI